MQIVRAYTNFKKDLISSFCYLLVVGLHDLHKWHSLLLLTNNEMHILAGNVQTVEKLGLFYCPDCGHWMWSQALKLYLLCELRQNWAFHWQCLYALRLELLNKNQTHRARLGVWPGAAHTSYLATDVLMYIYLCLLTILSLSLVALLLMYGQ